MTVAFADACSATVADSSSATFAAAALAAATSSAALAATSGVDVQSPRWQTCLSKAVGAFGFAAAHEYVIANFEESAKVQADKMVENLRAAFKELVEETDWMDAETQVKAQEKADQMLQLIGYPDWLLDNAEVDKYYG